METFCNFNNLAYLQSLHILLFNFVFHTWFHLFMGDFRKHFCTWYGHLRTLLQLGRYFQTNCCCMMCGKIFLDYYPFSVWSFQKWSFAIKDKIGDNDFELACFSYTHIHIHTHTLLHKYTKDLGKIQRHKKLDLWGLLFHTIQQFNGVIITYPEVFLQT